MNYGWLLAMAASQGEGGSSGKPLLMMFIAIGVLFYFIILRPQKRQKNERQQTLDALKKGDKVTTIGGMHGVIVRIDNKNSIVTVELAKNVRVDFSRSAISNIVKKIPEKDSGKKDSDSKDSDSME